MPPLSTSTVEELSQERAEEGDTPQRLKTKMRSHKDRVTVGVDLTEIEREEGERGKCWQRIVRDRHNSEGSPLPTEELVIRGAQVRTVTNKFAARIIHRYEWLGTMAPSSDHFGIFFSHYCAGVTCVTTSSGTASQNTSRMFGLTQHQLGILARGACVHWAPTGANSKLISWTVKLLGRGVGSHPYKLLIAYSDPDAGEIGTVYQACGWTYIGRTERTLQWVSPKGEIRDKKHPYNLAKRKGQNPRYWSERLYREGWTRQYSSAKYRYACVVDKNNQNLVQRLKGMSLPYPKRRI